MNLQPNNGKKIEKIGTVGKRKLMMGHVQNSPRKKQQKSSIFRRILPAELLNELFAALPLENAFTLLTKMPNVLLARNIQKMTNTKKSMTANKLNSSNCGRKLIVLQKGLVVKHSGSYGSNSIRAIFPIASFNLGNKGPTIAFYFEVKILKKATGNGFGFCGKNFPLESEIKCLGRENSTIGIWTKGGILIDGSFAKFEKNGGDFKQADIIGLGIIHCPANSSMKCFATCNGELLGKANLPSTFSKLQLYPALTLVSKSTSMRINFGKEKWHFKQFKKVLK